ncbi:ATP-binding protein [soil metagenome]
MPESVTALPQRLLDGLAEGIILVEGGRVSYLNAAAANFLGVDAAQSRGLPLIAVVRDHRLERAYTEQTPLECETRARILKATPLPGGLSLQDLTEQKRAQETARELLGVLSHELRTPVATIRATLEALRADLPLELRERFLERAEAESERLVRLLNDLTVDVKPPQYRSVYAPDVVARAVSLVGRTLTEHGVCLQQEVAPLTVWADADKLLQVLINLLENAAVHGPDHERVVLSVSLDREHSQYARFTVQDAGAPLEPAVIKKLFEPHARGASVKAKGTGLGLYIVRSIAERWGGRAWGQAVAGGNEFGVSVRLKA